MSNWISNFASQASSLIDNLTDTIIKTANDAQNEILAEQNKIKSEESIRNNRNNKVLLPWERDENSVCEELQLKIMSLPLSEYNFTKELPESKFAHFHFVFNDYVPVALKLLNIDANLSKIHSKLTPHMGEDLFWRRYFLRVKYLQYKFGVTQLSESDRNLFSFNQEEEDKIIFVNHNVPLKAKEDLLSLSSNDITVTTTSVESKVEVGSSSCREFIVSAADSQKSSRVQEVQPNLEPDSDDLADLVGLDDLDLEAAALELSDLEEERLLRDILADSALEGLEDDEDYDIVAAVAPLPTTAAAIRKKL